MCAEQLAAFLDAVGTTLLFPAACHKTQFGRFNAHSSWLWKDMTPIFKLYVESRKDKSH